MSEFLCRECVQSFEAAEMRDCPACGSDDVEQTCPMCGSIIDSDTKVCPECKETAA